MRVHTDCNRVVIVYSPLSLRMNSVISIEVPASIGAFTFWEAVLQSRNLRSLWSPRRPTTGRRTRHGVQVESCKAKFALGRKFASIDSLRDWTDGFGLF